MTAPALSLAEAQAHYGVREWGVCAPLAVRMFRRTVENGDGCWIWQGVRQGAGGYGRIWPTRGPSVATHRLAYELLVGPIPDGLVLDHLCRTPACLRPSHLEPVTEHVNIMRGISPAALNATKGACLRGHSFDEKNTYLRLTGGRACRRCATEIARRVRATRAAVAA